MPQRSTLERRGAPLDRQDPFYPCPVRPCAIQSHQNGAPFLGALSAILLELFMSELLLTQEIDRAQDPAAQADHGL